MGRKLTIQTVVAIGFAIACDPSEAEPTGAIAEFDFEFETGGDQTPQTRPPTNLGFQSICLCR